VTRPQLEPVAGDTGLFPAMRLLAGRVDVALLPVGGWGPTLGRGHLDPRGAAEAVAQVHPAIAMPIHWGALYPVGLRRFARLRFDRSCEAFREVVAARGARVGVAWQAQRRGEREGRRDD
jgi:L-ascorbate metabolism protein UlaG (beta-lactamase superfamily)